MVYDIVNPCSFSSSYTPPQSNAELLILNGPLPASSDFSPLFPVFILHFYYLKNASRLSISYFKAKILFRMLPMVSSMFSIGNLHIMRHLHL